MSSDGGSVVDLEIERLRRRLKKLEGQQETASSRSSSYSIRLSDQEAPIATTRASSSSSTPAAKTRRRRAGNKGPFGFAYNLSNSTRNLGQRQSTNNTANLMQTQGHASRSMSVTSTGDGSVGGVFGDSDDEESDGDNQRTNIEASSASLGLVGGLTRIDDHSFSQFDQIKQSFSGDVMTTMNTTTNARARLKRNDSYDARKGSDDDMKGGGFSTDDDDGEVSSVPSFGPRGGALRNIRQNSYRNIRQNSYRNIRTISMTPNLPYDDNDDGSSSRGDGSDSSDTDLYTDVSAHNTTPTDKVQPVVLQQRSNMVHDIDNDFLDEMLPKSIMPLPTTSEDGEEEASLSTGSLARSSASLAHSHAHPQPHAHQRSGSGSHLTRKASSAMGRRSSYENVMPLSIGPGGKAAIMESSHNRLDLDNEDDDTYDDDYVDDDFSNEERFPTFETLCAPSFSQFAMLQIQPEQLLLVENEYLFFDDGPTHLDSFLLSQEMEIGDHYTAHANRPIDPASVSAFCFPDGLRVRYLPKAGLAGAQRMGWVGPKGDRCHVIVFTNGNGVTEHGVAITVQWEMNLKKNERQALSSAVYKRRKRRRASRQIQQWWRHQVQDRVLREALAIAGFAHGHYSPADLKDELAASELKLLEQALKHTSNNRSVMMDPSSQGKSKVGRAARRQMKKKGISHKVSTVFEVDTATVEVVTRAAVMRSPNSTFRHEAAPKDSTFSDDNTTTDEEDIKGGRSSRGFALLKKVSSRGSGRLSMRSLNSNRSMIATAHSDSQSLSPQAVRPTRAILTRRPSKRCIEMARESYETMKENDRMGSICVVEKCYTLIGCQPDEHVLLFGPLQQLINSEREEILVFRRSRNDIQNKKRPKERTIDDVEEERRLEIELKSRRHIVIKAMREKLRLTTRQALVTFPRSQLEHINGKLHYFEAFVPQIPNCDTIKLPLPLPRIGKEWALAQFLLDIGPDSLVLCLKLMLLERSVLVLGENLQHVSMFACGLIELLRPFEWASAFMPVLPQRMLDFINAPVPFIAGVAARNVSEIENDSRVLEAMENGMSLLNLKTNTLHITTEVGINKMISLDPYLREKLKQLRSRLQHFVREDPQSPLRNFNTFFRFGLSRRESVTLRSVCRVLEQHFSHFCGDLAVNDKAWKRYGTVDVETDEFIFKPEWFLNPVRADQAFHEAMVQTQLFSGYVHEQREDQTEMREIMEGELGCFIADWVYDKWMSKVPPSHRQLMR